MRTRFLIAGLRQCRSIYCCNKYIAVIITLMVVCAFWIMRSKSQSSEQRGHFENIVHDRSPELHLPKMVRCSGVSVFQGQRGDLHFSLQWVIFHATQFRSKLVIEKCCISMRSCAKICQLCPYGTLILQIIFRSQKPQDLPLMEPTQSQSMFLWSPGKEVSDQHIDLLVQPGKWFIFPKAETYIWCLGYVVELFALEIQERCTR